MRHGLQRLSPQVTVMVLAALVAATPGHILAHGVLAHGVLAHSGHGNEFQGGSQPAQSKPAIQVDGETADRLGLKVEPVLRRSLAFGIKTTGQIETLPNQRVEVTTPVKGTIVELLVQPGDQVDAGQAVAMMTSPELAELRTSALDRRSEAIAATQAAEADLRLAEQTVNQQQTITAADVAQAQIDLSFAQEQYDKDQELAASGAIPRRTLLESETKLAAAKSALARAESRLQVSEATAQLRRAESAVQVAESRVQLSDETYQTRLRQLGVSANEDGTIAIMAPIAGSIADVHITPGESGEDAGKTVMTIVNTSIVQVSANVYEKDLERIRVGQGMRVTVASLPDRTFPGRIRVVGEVVEGETRIVPVKAQLDNANGALKPGMFAELEVLIERTPASVLAIPKSAVVKTNANQTIVFVQNGAAFEPIEVTLGREAGDLVEIQDGLFEGDRVVTQRANQLYAQSLRGGGNAADDRHDAESATPKSAIPWWVVIPAAGAGMAGMFWAGMAWGKRGDRPAVAAITNDTIISPATEGLNPTQNGYVLAAPDPQPVKPLHQNEPLER